MLSADFLSNIKKDLSSKYDLPSINWKIEIKDKIAIIDNKIVYKRYPKNSCVIKLRKKVLTLSKICTLGVNTHYKGLKNIFGDYISSSANWLFVLYTYVEGEELSLNNVYGYSLGCSLANLHNALAKISTFDTEGLVRFKPENISAFHNMKLNINSTVNPKLLELKLHLISVDKIEEIVSKKFNPKLIHGDVRLKNIIIGRNSIEFIDFDNLGVFFQSYDLFRFIFIEFGDFRKSISQNFVKDFFIGYNSIIKLSSNDIEDSLNRYYAAQVLDDFGLKGNEMFPELIQKKHQLLVLLSKNRGAFINFFIKIN